MSDYPNLELLEYKVREILIKDEDFIRSLKDKRLQIELDVDVFPQTWASTALGFDTGGCMAGQAITKAYTTVFYETRTDTYVVCFGDRIAYKVTDANDFFFEDLTNRNMASVRKAKIKY